MLISVNGTLSCQGPTIGSGGEGSGTYRAAHVRQGILGPVNSGRLCRDAKFPDDVRTELHGYSHGHDEVDERDGVEANVP